MININNINITEKNFENMEKKSFKTMMLREKRKRKNYAAIPLSFQNNKIKGINNGRWTLEEHRKFIFGILKYGNKWKEICQEIKTRNTGQARSHGQKFFSKLYKFLRLFAKTLFKETF